MLRKLCHDLPLQPGMLIFLLWFSSQAIALDPSLRTTQYLHSVFSQEHGLPQLTVQDIYQDRVGYLWIATQEGIARFDGLRFLMLEEVFGLSERIRDTVKIFEDSDGTLWIGTLGNGLYEVSNQGQYDAKYGD